MRVLGGIAVSVFVGFGRSGRGIAVRTVLTAAVAGLLVVGMAGVAKGVEVSQLPAGPTVTGLTGARPNATRISFPITDHVSVSVDVATGNLMVTTTGIRLVSPTSPVPLGATYNSLSSLAGSSAFSPAPGWNWAFDGAGGLSETDSGVVYTGADGSTWLFTPVSVPPRSSRRRRV